MGATVKVHGQKTTMHIAETHTAKASFVTLHFAAWRHLRHLRHLRQPTMTTTTTKTAATVGDGGGDGIFWPCQFPWFANNLACNGQLGRLLGRG